MTHPGPCASCGATNYEDIGGDPRICPRCDCGAGQKDAPRRLREAGERIATLETEIARLTAEQAAAQEEFARLRAVIDAAALDCEDNGVWDGRHNVEPGNPAQWIARWEAIEQARKERP